MLHIDPPDYKYCPLCSTSLSIKQEEGKDRKYCHKCGWVYYPRMATSAAAVIVKDNQVLMVQRNREPFKGTWMFPAGYVDFGEHPKETVVREVKEETGLDVVSVQLIDVVQSVDDYREPGHFLYFYKVSIKDGTLQTDTEENQGIQWFPISKPPTIGWITHKDMMTSLQKNEL